MSLDSEVISFFTFSALPANFAEVSSKNNNKIVTICESNCRAMSGHASTVNQDSGCLPDAFSGSTEEVTVLYESILSSGDNGALMSCPVLGFGVQTVAAETTNVNTDYSRPDGISSLPLMLGNIDNGLRSPVETTVLDSSSPLDGISLHHLLYAIVEITPECLPEDHRYHGNSGVVVNVDEMSCSVCVQMMCDSIQLNIAKSRMLKLCRPMTGDVVRVIRGGCHVGSVGCITSQNDGSHAVVKLDDNSPTAIINISDLVRLDSSQCTSTTDSSPPGVGDSSMSSPSAADHVSSSSYSTGWRVNSPIPPSPIDSGTYENSPTSSLISNSVTSPGNSWNTSNDPCPIKDFSFGLPSESHNSSSTSSSGIYMIGTGNMYSTQSLPNHPSTTTGIFTKTESHLGESSAKYPVSLPPRVPPPAYSNGGNMLSVPSPHSSSSIPPPVSPSSNLYPVLNTTTDSNGYSPRPSSGPQSESHISYPTLPSYAAATPTNYTQQQQQSPYTCTPMLLGNPNAGYAIYGYQQSATPLYQPKTSVPVYKALVAGQAQAQAQPYAQVQVGTASRLYPQLQSYSPQQQQSFSYQQQNISGSGKNYNQCASNRKNPSSHSLYPKLPRLSPWEEFRILVGNSVQNRLSSQNRSLETVINLAIEALSNKEPPDHWYNPLAQSDDDEMSTDVSTESVRVSALCPLIRTKMDYPCRGLECTHLQCFDAKAYLRLALKRRSQLVSNLKRPSVSPSCDPDNGWKCPTCGKVVSVNQLYIDKYLRKAIATYDDAVELEFKGPGRWLPYEKRQTLSNSVIDLTMDSDEDI